MQDTLFTPILQHQQPNYISNHS